MNHIVLISGKMGSGKTTLANSLIESLNRRGHWIGHSEIFAEPLYKMHDACREIIRNLGVEPPHPNKDGNLLQLLGTEWGRKTLGDDIWIRLLKNEISKMEKIMGKYNPNVVSIVSDCRFKNEFNALPQAYRVRLECQRHIRKGRVAMWRDNETHQSEIDLDEYADQGKFDYVFDTDKYSVAHCTDIIIAQLLKGDWAQRRDP